MDHAPIQGISRTATCPSRSSSSRTTSTAPQRYHYRTLAFDFWHCHVVLRLVPGASETQEEQCQHFFQVACKEKIGGCEYLCAIFQGLPAFPCPHVVLIFASLWALPRNFPSLLALPCSFMMCHSPLHFFHPASMPASPFRKICNSNTLGTNWLQAPSRQTFPI